MREVPTDCSQYTTLQLILRFGYQFFWFIITIVTLPNQVEEIMGGTLKGSGMAVISLTSGILFLVLSPIAGALNDRYHDARWGKRHPWILLGTIGMITNLFFLSGQNSLFGYTMAYLSLNIFSIICSIPFNGLVADITPREQNGHVSSVMGAMNLFGYLTGAILGIGAAHMI